MDSEKKEKKTFTSGAEEEERGGGMEKPRTIPVYVYQGEGRKWTKKLNFNEFEGGGVPAPHSPCRSACIKVKK